MQDIQLGVIEARFADIIWENEPVSSSELVRLCAEEFGWKRSTTFTVLKRLCCKGLFQNEKGVVSSLVSREGYFPCAAAAWSRRASAARCRPS